MQITHEEARRLIQFKADDSLSTTNEQNLSEHLNACTECQGYFGAVKQTESTLRQILRKQWNVHPLPLQMEAVYAKVNLTPGTSILLTTRKALIGVAFVMVAFITWQSMTSNSSSAQTPLGTVPLIPTPSTQYTATNTLQSDCKEVRYVVQPGDTLDSVAQHFSTSKESIIAANRLTSDAINPTEEMIIPFCESTPTSTTHPPTFTITPNFETISTTPG